MQSQERSRQNITAVLFLIVAIAVILLFASGLSTLKLSPGGSLNVLAALTEKLSPAQIETPSTPGVDSPVDGQSVMTAVRVLFWVLLFLAVIYAFVSPQFRKQLIRYAIIVGLLLFVLNRVREAMTPNEKEETPIGVAELPPPSAAGAQLPDPPAIVTSTPEWIVWTINILVALTVIALIWFLWRKLRPQPEEDVQVQVVQQAEDALAELEQGGDLRDVILRCYTQMGAVLHENNNISRQSAMTARDFEEHLARLGFDDEHISRLTRLFEAARYSPNTPGPEAEKEAVACLTAIVEDYGGDGVATRHHVAGSRRDPDLSGVAQQP